MYARRVLQCTCIFDGPARLNGHCQMRCESAAARRQLWGGTASSAASAQSCSSVPKLFRPQQASRHREPTSAAGLAAAGVELRLSAVNCHTGAEKMAVPVFVPCSSVSTRPDPTSFRVLALRSCSFQLLDAAGQAPLPWICALCVGVSRTTQTPEIFVQKHASAAPKRDACAPSLSESSTSGVHACGACLIVSGLQLRGARREATAERGLILLHLRHHAAREAHHDPL